MTFYESIFLRQFSMKLLGLPTTKHFFSFILGCPQDFNFARPFWYGWVETGLNDRNGLQVLQAFLSKTFFGVGTPQSFTEKYRYRN